MQVAALLISASYGVGFLFGSGELAVTHGMAGSLYPWLTALGMGLLALSAGKVWLSRMAIWDVFGDIYGVGVKHQVALLSLIWMTGVLAAQIHGGVAVLLLCGLPNYLAFPGMLGLIFGASQLNLRAASKVFSLCLLASSFVLVFSLRKVGGEHIYFEAAPRFVNDVKGISIRELITMTLAIVFLVVTGADYQQFVIAARSRTDAILGCGCAAIGLLVLGALPASAVVAARDAGLLTGMSSAKEAIPIVLADVSSQVGRGWGVVMLLALLAAALGSSSAIIRAMTSASALVLEPKTCTGRACASLGIVSLGGIVAERGQGIIQTMVDLNVVYIASVAPLFVLLLAGVRVMPDAAKKAINAGFMTATCFYVGKWTGLFSGQTELTGLALGTFASLVALEIHRRRNARSISGMR
ncbi:hypothetical protein [Paraburkholderia caballeronis]|uniref:hypothetical protein n=1 Tax=Paraburkholderia caballeronis TaxID=416943 RepID=UPI00106480E6|nr:hypothetical protein [Paraburkholderia caballeronis]